MLVILVQVEQKQNNNKEREILCTTFIFSILFERLEDLVHGICVVCSSSRAHKTHSLICWP